MHLWKNYKSLMLEVNKKRIRYKLNLNYIIICLMQHLYCFVDYPPKDSSNTQWGCSKLRTEDSLVNISLKHLKQNKILSPIYVSNLKT